MFQPPRMDKTLQVEVNIKILKPHDYTSFIQIRGSQNPPFPKKTSRVDWRTAMHCPCIDLLISIIAAESYKQTQTLSTIVSGHQLWFPYSYRFGRSADGSLGSTSAWKAVQAPSLLNWYMCKQPNTDLDQTRIETPKSSWVWLIKGPKVRTSYLSCVEECWWWSRGLAHQTKPRKWWILLFAVVGWNLELAIYLG